MNYSLLQLNYIYLFNVVRGQKDSYDIDIEDITVNLAKDLLTKCIRDLEIFNTIDLKNKAVLKYESSIEKLCSGSELRTLSATNIQTNKKVNMLKSYKEKCTLLFEILNKAYFIDSYEEIIANSKPIKELLKNTGTTKKADTHENKNIKIAAAMLLGED